MPTAGKDIIGLWLIVLAAMNLSQAASSDCENPPLDISIVIDQTKSVGADNYDAMLDSVMALISQYDIGEDKTHFSIVTYAKGAKVRVSFDNLKHQNQAALRALIEKMKKKDKLGNPTRTDNALKVVGEDVFNEKNGDRPESPNVMIIFTDGGTHKSSKPYSTVLPTLEEKGVHRVAVGIGKKIKQAELITIAGDENRVVNAKNVEDLNNQLDDIRKATCNIDGGYTEWSEWSECTATCGGGSRSHSRTCTNPSPKNKGKTCIEQDLGPDMESEQCNTRDCPIPGGYTGWSEWGECSVTCGGGVQTRKRTCTNPPPSGGGPTCIEQNLGPAEEQKECNSQDCDIDGGYTEWSEWSECTATCGGGSRSHSRTCTNPSPKNKGKTCIEQDLGPNMESEECNTQDCPIPGGYTDWSEWGECSVTCGGGVQTRKRTCTNPPPSGGGPTCIEQNLGPAEEQKECNSQDCGEDGNWSPWGAPGPCDKTCGGGTRVRKRTCTDPPPSGDGKDCAGSSTKDEPCNTQACPTSPPPPPPPKPCKEHLDVGVIVDSSNSISSVDYNRARDYLVRLAQRLEVSEAGTHMAILLYSWEAHLWHRFTNPQNINALTAKARSLPHIRGGTRTDRALELAAEEFFGWDNSGDRPDKPNVLLVLTDGDTNEGSKPFSQVTPPLNDASVRRIAVGIGSGIDISELQQIASANHDVIQVNGYQQLIPRLESIMTKACEDQYPGDCGEWGSYGGCSRNCGGGAQVRTRSCPPKSLHLTKQRKHCNTNLCPGQEPCEDRAGNCAVRAAKGDCWRTANVPASQHLLYVGRTFPLWKTCPKSCRRCNVDTSCQDDDPYVCPWWSVADRNSGKCSFTWRQRWTLYSLANYCKKSCGKCSGGGGACQDFNFYYCRSKVKWPGCGNYYVRGKCKKSCGLCSGGSGGGGGWGRR
ncbi:coadhesin [Pocillopora verrucosa]|uniref:coadhesin n=1 Tax=Pocillopora verrucosa TaxID=203993 RepID=UPI0033411879